MYHVWMRDSGGSKWRKLNTKEFHEEWEANYFIDRGLDVPKDGEAVALIEGETPWLSKSKNFG